MSDGTGDARDKTFDWNLEMQSAPADCNGNPRAAVLDIMMGNSVEEMVSTIVRKVIASLKAALARKDGESEHLQFARPSTPDRLKMKSGSSSPSNSSSQSVGDVSSNRRKPMEEVGNTGPETVCNKAEKKKP